MSVISNLISKTIPYVVGGASSNNSIPLNVQLQIDQNFKRSIYTTVGIIGVSAIIAALIIARKNKRK